MEGRGGGAGDHGRRWTHAAGHHRGRRHMTGAQVCAGTGGLICGRRGRPKEGTGLGIRL